MKPFNTCLITIYFLVITVSCTGPAKETNEAAKENSDKVAGIDSLSYAWIMRDEDSGNCGQDGEGCASIRVTYPKFEGNSNLAIQDSLNNLILSILINTYANDAESLVTSVDGMISQFLNDYNEFSAEFHGSKMGWVIEEKVKIELNIPEVISLTFVNYTFTGGAHGYGGKSFFNFNPDLARRIQLSDVFIKGYESKLNKIGEMTFRSVRQIPDNQSLSEAGFDFSGDSFHLNNNFLLGGEGITFYFDSYEVGPYALGPTEIFFPWNEIKNLLQPGWPSGSKNTI